MSDGFETTIITLMQKFISSARREIGALPGGGPSVPASRPHNRLPSSRLAADRRNGAKLRCSDGRNCFQRKTGSPGHDWAPEHSTALCPCKVPTRWTRSATPFD